MPVASCYHTIGILGGVSKSNMEEIELDIKSIENSSSAKLIFVLTHLRLGNSTVDDLQTVLQLGNQQASVEDIIRKILSHVAPRVKLCSGVDGEECIRQLTTVNSKWFTLGILSGISFDKCMDIHVDEKLCSAKFRRVVRTLASMCCLRNLKHALLKLDLPIPPCLER